jgi:hypothetical protein
LQPRHHAHASFSAHRRTACHLFEGVILTLSEAEGEGSRYLFRPTALGPLPHPRDATGANLPLHFAPWTSFKPIELTRDEPTPGLNTNECLDDIEKYSFHITDAHTRLTQTMV